MRSFLIIKLEHEIRRKPQDVTLDRLEENLSLYSIEQSKVVAEHHLLAPEKKDVCFEAIVRSHCQVIAHRAPPRAILLLVLPLGFLGAEPDGLFLLRGLGHELPQRFEDELEFFVVGADLGF